MEMGRKTACLSKQIGPNGTIAMLTAQRRVAEMSL